MHPKIKTQKKGKSKFHIGLALLRPFLSFLVIISHCYNSGYADGIWKIAFIKTEG